MATQAQCYCEKCNKTMAEDNFYMLKDGSRAKLCKKCLTMHIDNFDTSTFFWILELLDLPYVPEKWNEIRDKAFAKDPTKLTGMSVLGKYISVMKLKQFKDYGWADTEKIMNEAEEKRRAYEEKHPELVERTQRLKEQYEAGQISEAQYKTLVSVEGQKEALETNPAYLDALYSSANGGAAGVYGVPQGQTFIQESELPDPAAELTEEDKVYLAMKWGRFYQPNEWITLEQTYEEYMDSFDVQEADSRNNIMLICKTFLKMNEAINSGDFDSFTKLNRAYESLRKTAKLTAAQNKEQKDNFVDCIGNMVVICERDGFIPTYALDKPNDIIDKVIEDMNNFTRTFAKDNLGLGQQLDMYLKRIEIQKQIEEDDGSAYTDEDFEEWHESVEEQRNADEVVHDVSGGVD